MNIPDLKEKATLIRKWSLISTTKAASGHPTSAMSATDISVVLFEKYFQYDIKNPLHPNNDRFVLSKGHAAPLLYALFAMSGAFPIEKLRTLRRIDSELEGHPTPRFKFAEAATGSLGQGLSVGAGLAISGKKDNLPFKTYVLSGDGELAEGSAWEAANFASYYKLSNLILIADINRLGQSQHTMFQHDLEEYVQRFSAFGWEVVTIDGHNFEEIDRGLNLAVHNKSDKPFAIIAKTKKGRGVSFLEDKDGWHGKPLKEEDLQKALAELGEVDDNLRFRLRSPEVSGRKHLGGVTKLTPRDRSFTNAQDDILFKIGDKVGTRDVYGKILVDLAANNPLIVALDGDVKNSTYSEDFLKVYPERFIQCFIAEQNMVGVAMGFSRMGKIPFVSTFACFLSRAFDQIRMAAVSGANIKFVGSHAGVSIGQDGPSQMGLEEIAMFGALPDTIIFQPCDAVSSAKLIPLMASYIGISYLQTLRPKTPVIYGMDEEFVIGGSKILKSSKKDLLTITATGITVHEALKAYEELKKEGISVRIIDCYSIKPIDKGTLIESINSTKKNVVITVEDHFAHGGLGDFVLDALSDQNAEVIKLAVKEISRSGKPEELLDLAGISAKHIVEEVKSLL